MPEPVSLVHADRRDEQSSATDYSSAETTHAAEEEPSTDADGRQRTKKDKAPTGDDQKSGADKPHDVGNVNNHFYREVNAGIIGVGSGETSRTKRATGHIAEDEISGVTDRYGHDERFDAAADTLDRCRVLVLRGSAGTGRRACAIAMLRAAATGRLIRLSPLNKLKELAERSYNSGAGYLIEDWVAEKHSAETGVAWSEVHDQVTELGAHLIIVTTADIAHSVGRSVGYVDWQRPAAEAVLRGQLMGLGHPADDVDATVAALVESMPGEGVTLRRLVSLAELVADGDTVADALATPDHDAAVAVTEWFGSEPSWSEIIEVTALSFMEGVDLRTFETLLADVRELLAARMPKKQADLLRDETDPLGDRSGRLVRHPLIELRTHDDGTRLSTSVRFREAGYTPAVMQRLWSTGTAEYWNAVAQWLEKIVGAGGGVTVARGLANLATIEYAAVERRYLDRWAWGELGVEGQTAAIYVLWFACRTGKLGPAALQTVVRWTQDRDVDVRWTAMVSLTGDLGITYPTEAATRIWQLIAQSNDLEVPGISALATLFATLVDATPDAAHFVPSLLDQKLTRLTAPGSRTRSIDSKVARDRVMTAILAVLSVLSARTGRSAVFDYLAGHPDRSPLLAGLWAGVIRFRPLRRSALIALRRGLHHLRDGADNPLVVAGKFGSALSAVMDPVELKEFTRDFVELDRQLRRGTDRSPAAILKACLDAMTRPATDGGTS